MRAAFVIAVVAALGCGRRGFDVVSDAPSADGSARTDALPGDGTPSLCAGSTALVCDGFEQGLALWNQSSVNGMINLDTTRAFRGAASVHLAVGPIAGATTNPRASLMTYQGLDGGAVTGTLYAREWVYFASPHPTTEFDQLINFSDDVGNGLSVGTRNGVLVNNDYTGGAYLESQTVSLPLDRWTCLQLEIPSGTLGTARIRVDGAEVTDIAIDKTMTQPNPTHVYIGMTWVGTVTSLPAVDTWIDEVIIDSAPTTCAQ